MNGKALLPDRNDWTLRKGYYDSTPTYLKQVKFFFEMGEPEMALEIVSTSESQEVLDFIPDAIWRKMGGKFRAGGKEKIFPRKLYKLQKLELRYKRSKINLQVLRRIIILLPLSVRDKLYSLARLADLHASLRDRTGYGEDFDYRSVQTAPEADKRLQPLCLQQLKKLSERIEHEYRYKFHDSLAYYDAYLLKLTSRYYDLLEQESRIRHLYKNEFKQAVHQNMSIATEFIVPIKRLNAILGNTSKPYEIFSIIRKDSKRVAEVVKDLAEEAILKGKVKVQVKSVKFLMNDLEDIAKGHSIYEVILYGKMAALRQIAGPEKAFEYMW